MSISRADAKRTAELAKLEFDTSELSLFVEQFQKVLDHFESIQEAKTNHVEPLYQPVSQQETPMRSDKVERQMQQGDALRAAPSKERGHFRVPRVID
jgi:aspartyl-tRNA(Asn)/glutamyl-tRNA(Gln) amidotransferase subunit C